MITAELLRCQETFPLFCSVRQGPTLCPFFAAMPLKHETFSGSLHRFLCLTDTLLFHAAFDLQTERISYPLKYMKEFQKGFVSVCFDRLFSVNFVGKILFSNRLSQMLYVNNQQSGSLQNTTNECICLMLLLYESFNSLLN